MGGVLRLGRDLAHPGITQGRGIGDLESKLCTTGYACWFIDLVKGTENVRGGSRVCPTVPRKAHKVLATQVPGMHIAAVKGSRGARLDRL